MHLKLLLIVLLTLFCNIAKASVTETIFIKSSPVGADVYLLKGNRQTLLGKTPLNIDIKFRSKYSIKRILLKKDGYNNLEKEISLDKSDYSFNLASRSFFRDSETIDNPALKKLQTQINNKLRSGLLLLFSKSKQYKFNIKDVHVDNKNNEIALNIPLNLIYLGKIKEPSNKSEASSLSESVWSVLENRFIKISNNTLINIPDIKQVNIIVNTSVKASSFSVGFKPENVMEMVCEAGTVMTAVHDSCASRRTETERYGNNMYTRQVCIPGTVMRPVHNSCAKRVPKAKTVFKSNPNIKFGNQSSSLTISIPSNFFKKTSIPLNEINVSYVDSNGSILFSK